MRGFSRTLAIGLCLALFTQPTYGTEWDPDAEPQPQEAEGVSCMKMCLEEGEDPMECNYYCIQVVRNGAELRTGETLPRFAGR